MMVLTEKSQWKGILGFIFAGLFWIGMAILAYVLVFEKACEEKESSEKLLMQSQILMKEKAQLPSPLKAIDKLHVLVEFISEDARKIGLTEKMLKNVAESKLRKTEIVIIGLKEYIECPDLYINVYVTKLAFSVFLSIEEFIRLERDPTNLFIGITWYRGKTGTHGGDPEFIASTLSQALDDFLDDYYKANPKN